MMHAMRAWRSGRIASVLTIFLLAPELVLAQASVPIPSQTASSQSAAANLVPGNFDDITSRAGVTFLHQAPHTSRKYLIETMGSGVGLFDYDNDGRLDLFLVNGAPFADPTPKGTIPQKADPRYWNRLYHQKADGTFEDVTDTIELTFPQLRYRETMLLARNVKGKKFVDVSSIPGDVFSKHWVGRGMAIGDINNDGLVDAVVTENGGRLTFSSIEQELAITGSDSSWLATKATGTQLALQLNSLPTADHSGQTTSGSYLSSSDKRLNFGLGTEAIARSIEIRWPSGIVQTLKDVNGNRYLTIDEPAGSSTR